MQINFYYICNVLAWLNLLPFVSVKVLLHMGNYCDNLGRRLDLEGVQWPILAIDGLQAGFKETVEMM